MATKETFIIFKILYWQRLGRNSTIGSLLVRSCVHQSKMSEATSSPQAGRHTPLQRTAFRGGHKVALTLIYALICVCFHGDGGLSLLAAVNAQQPQGPSTVYISEVMARNKNYPIPIDQSTPDWIEIHNYGTEWVNMAGFTISDNEDGGSPFVFPEGVTIGPNERKVFLADGSGRIVSGTVFLDFKLSGDGETLRLFDANGQLLSEMVFPALEEDEAYGLVSGAPPNSKDGYDILANPTAGAENSGAAPGKRFNIQYEDVGPVDGSFDVQITVEDQKQPIQGVWMTYRVNRGEAKSIQMTPSNDGTYKATIPSQAPGSMIQWHFTITDASGDSIRYPPFENPTDQEFFGTFVDDPALDTNLPVIYINCKDEKAPFTEGKDATPGCSIMINDKFYDNIIIRRRGMSSLAWPKPKFKIDAGEQGKIFELFEDDDRKVKEFNMNSEWFEPGENSFMRETVAWKALKEMGVDALDYYQTQVRLNGDYFGKFSLGEDWDADPLEESGYALTGPLMKSISGEYSNLRWDVDPWQAMYYYRPITIESDDAFIQLGDLTKGLAGGICQSRSAYVYDNLDLPKVVNYMAAMTILLNQDRCTKNFYVYKDPRTEQWSVLPWDVEASFGTDRGLGGRPAPDYCILDCEQWNSPLYCDKYHPQDLLVTTPWGLITTDVSPQRSSRRLLQGGGFPGMTEGTPLNGAAKVGQQLPETSSIRPDYDADQRPLIPIPSGVNGTYNYLIDAVLSIPTTRAMYVRRLRTLMDEFLAGGRLEQLVTEEYELIKDEAKRDVEFWGSSGSADRGYQQIIAEQIPIRTSQLYEEYSSNGPIPLIPDAQPSDLNVDVTEVIPGSNGYVKLSNPNDIALDISGWSIKGDGFSFEFIPGTVIPANGEVYVASDPLALRESMAPSPEQCSQAFIVGGGDFKGDISSSATVATTSISK